MLSIQQSKAYSRMVRRDAGTRLTHVTNGWFVGSTISYPAGGPELRLSLFKSGGKLGHRIYHHPMDGTLFASEQDRDAWLIDHGFLVVHYRAVWCQTHRRQHRWCHSRTPGCAVNDGYPYDGCEEAQQRWDGEDWTWSKRTCADCGGQQWEPRWVQDVSLEHHGRTLCNQCVNNLSEGVAS